jgi:cytochrome c oxidase cbb3-type subunit 3
MRPSCNGLPTEAIAPKVRHSIAQGETLAFMRSGGVVALKGRHSDGPQSVKLMPYTICLLVTCLAHGCDLPGQPQKKDRPLPANEIVDFDVLFQRNCTGCHGPDGKLGPAPPLNDPIFLSIVPDDELSRVITEGRPGTPMAAFADEHGGPLTHTQVDVLAKGLKSRFGSPVDVKSPLPPYRAEARRVAGPSTEDVSRGEKLFARACAECHGKHGEGTDSAGALADPAFLGLVSDQALRRVIITGRSDLGMPNFADGTVRGAGYKPLSSGEIDSLVAFLGSWRRGPPPDSRGETHTSTKRGEEE